MQFSEEDWCWPDTIKRKVVVTDPAGNGLERNSSNELFKNAKTSQKVSARPLTLISKCFHVSIISLSPARPGGETMKLL